MSPEVADEMIMCSRMHIIQCVCIDFPICTMLSERRACVLYSKQNLFLKLDFANYDAKKKKKKKKAAKNSRLRKCSLMGKHVLDVCVVARAGEF